MRVSTAGRLPAPAASCSDEEPAMKERLGDGCWPLRTGYSAPHKHCPFKRAKPQSTEIRSWLVHAEHAGALPIRNDTLRFGHLRLPRRSFNVDALTGESFALNCDMRTQIAQLRLSQPAFDECHGALAHSPLFLPSRMTERHSFYVATGSWRLP